MGKLLGIGECMVELSQASGGLLRQSFAGDVFNTLWHAARCFRAAEANWHCAFYSAVGTDPLSQSMLAFGTVGGIDMSAVRQVPDRRPGLYMIHLTGAERSFSYWREHSAARLLAADASPLRTALADAACIYVSGITLAILPKADRETLFDALRTAGTSGIPIAFDPNIRPALWSDEAELRDCLTKAASLSDLVLPSFDDDAKTFGDSDPRATAARYQAASASLVVVKDGEGAVTVSNAGETETIPTPPVTDAVDTTGAGDSFNGAFLAAWLSGATPADAVASAQACAAQVIRHHGALTTDENGAQ